jgi:hypothetical protein
MMCGLDDPECIDEDISDTEYKYKQKEYEEYIKKNYPFSNMSWTPRVCIIKVNKNSV